MNVMRVLAEDIAFGLVNELQRRKAAPALPEPKAGDLHVEEIAQEAVSQQDNVQKAAFLEQKVLLQRLQQVESTLEKLARRMKSEQWEYHAGSDLGEKGSKYQNVDTLLKYVDGSGAEGGVKLVIMNFND